MKSKKIILFIVLLVLLIFSLFYFLFPRTNSSVSRNLISPVLEKTDFKTINKNEDVVTQPVSGAADNQVQEKIEGSITSINQLINKKFPEVGLQQLNTFLAIAVGNNVEDCQGLLNLEIPCQYYFAVYKGNSTFCAHMHGHEDAHEDVHNDSSIENMKLDCYKELILDEVDSKFKACQAEDLPLLKINCFKGLFYGSLESKDCSIFENKVIKDTCIDLVVLNFSIAQNKNNCDNIKDEDIKGSCKERFLVGDFDNDGLSDSEELKKGTNPYKPNKD